MYLKKTKIRCSASQCHAFASNNKILINNALLNCFGICSEFTNYISPCEKFVLDCDNAGSFFRGNRTQLLPYKYYLCHDNFHL